MTHVNTKKHTSTVKSAVIIAGIGVVTLFSVGCTSTNSLNFPNLTNNSANTGAQSEQRPQIAIAQLVGAPPSVAKSLSGALVTAATDRKFELAENKSDKTKYLMQGYLVADSTAKGTKLSYIWDITNPDGKRAHRIKGEELVSTGAVKSGGDPWKMVDDKIIKSVATKTTAQIATWLPEPPKPATAAPMLVSDKKSDPATTGSTKPAATKTASTTKKAKSAAPIKVATKSAPKALGGAKPIPTKKTAKPVKIVSKKATKIPADIAVSAAPAIVVATVPTVRGAPGDGKTSLTSAIKSQLGTRGVKLASGVSKAAYTVRGEVKLTQANQSDKEDIAIEWRVIDPNGRKLGTVSQRNSIPKGSLNGAWGKTADAAAAAAAEGIVKLLPKK